MFFGGFVLRTSAQEEDYYPAGSLLSTTMSDWSNILLY